MCAARFYAGENFDGVTAPALPAGWTTGSTTFAPGNLALTVTTKSHPRNSAFMDDLPVSTEKHLDSAPIAISSAVAQLSFQNAYDLESGYDGGVLEIE